MNDLRKAIWEAIKNWDINYGIEAVRDGEEVIEMRTHKGSLDTFPNLTYVNHLHEMFPLFRS